MKKYFLRQNWTKNRPLLAKKSASGLLATKWTIVSTRNPRVDQKWSTLDQKWFNPKSQVGPDLVHPGPLLVQPENA